MRVLVVSQDVKERLRAISALELHAAVEVEEAVTAAQARERILVEGATYDVLVVDGDLQPRGGFAMLYDLRSRAELEGIEPTPALVMTARDQDVWLAGWAGASTVLLKPVDPFELAKRVQALEGAEVPPYGDSGSAAQQVAAARSDQP